jgi:hypothetical protein
MKSRASYLYRGLIIYLCAVLLLPLLPAQAAAQVSSKAKKKVRVQLGKPQVWSIGQAHYLLANMRQVNRELKTHMPSEAELNPSASNATRIQILKTLLNAEVQFSQKDAISNQAAIRENQISLGNREEAQAALPAKRRQLAALDAEYAAMNRTLVEKQTLLNQMKAARQALAKPNATPPVPAPPPDKAENELDLEVELMKVDVAQKKAERDAVATEVGNLNTTANGTVGGPTLAEPQFSTAPRPLVGDLAPLVGKALDKAATTTPSVAASIALDNYIAMQYEIIAKQMTLLRTEIGPEERVIFLELPTSLYTIPCKADNHMVQLQWQVEEYIEDDDRLAQALASEGAQGLRTDFEEIERQKVRLENFRIRYARGTQEQRTQILGALSGQSGIDNNDYNYRWQPVRGDRYDRTTPSPQALLNEVTGSTDEQAQRYAVRALDIVPRQSALNVNSTYNTISQINFLGVLKFITGLGIKVDYQRQQELYEQYLQQEVFASGYGKGTDTFGWTFAPLPGTKRVAPGVRTTYAILAIPRKASALKLTVNAITYPRGGTPSYEGDSSQLVAKNTMIVRIPNEFTENFYVKEAVYTSVRKGERVGVLLKGDYFSPQLGVSINGVPLTRALSITNNESANATALAATVAGVQGAYELISSHELYMTFSVADKNIATPTITLVTPEKTSAINFFNLKINYHSGFTSLQKISKSEPMFVDDLDVAQKLQVIGGGNQRPSPNKPPVPYIRARLEGKGLRRNAEIYIDDSSTELRHLEDILEDLNKKMIEWKVDKDLPPRQRDDASLRIKDREKLKKDLLDEKMEEIRIKSEAQGRKLTSKEKERLEELHLERLNDHHEFFDAFYRKFKPEFIEDQIKLIKEQEPTITDEEARKKAEQKAKEFVTPDPNVEYADQDSTGAYILYFRQPQKAKWTVRYRNNTKQGYEEKVFEVERAVPFTHRVVTYKPAENDTANGKAKNKANADFEVTLEFSTDNYKTNPVTDISIDGEDGEATGDLDPGPEPEENVVSRKYRRTFLVKEEAENVPRDQITITVTREGLGKQEVKITLPLQPSITTIKNPNQGDKSQGFVDEEPVVVIRGKNLHHADKVFFGNKEATKFGEPTRTEIHVTVPKGEHLTDIKFRKVPVRVQTDAASGKSLSSNILFYTYIENIIPKKPESTRRRGRRAVKVIIPASSGSQTNPN